MNTVVGNITLTDSQQRALNSVIAFLGDENQKVFVLKGYAGTGKTTLVRAILSEIIRKECPYLLLASTGRAAKVLSDAIRCFSGETPVFPSASTIHSLIYTFSSISQDLDLFSQAGDPKEIASDKGVKLLFSLKKKEQNTSATTIYLVDEASMISDAKDSSLSQAQYGTEGKLLHDLMEYDPQGKFIFIGDACQLPPVNQSISPALSTTYLRDVFHIEAKECELTEIVRQPDGNDIPISAARMRGLYFNPPTGRIAWFPFRGYSNIHLLNNEYELLNHYISCIKDHDYNHATMIVFSNKSVMSLSNIIRPAIGFGSKSVSEGDLLLITQNNLISGLMNGDLVRVVGLGMRENRCGLTFTYVQVESLANGNEYSQLLLEDILYSGQTNLNAEQQTHLMIDFHIRMREKGMCVR